MALHCGKHNTRNDQKLKLQNRYSWSFDRYWKINIMRLCGRQLWSFSYPPPTALVIGEHKWRIVCKTGLVTSLISVGDTKNGRWNSLTTDWRVYEETARSRQHVTEWCRKFAAGNRKVTNEDRNGRLSAASTDLNTTGHGRAGSRTITKSRHELRQ